MKSLIYWLIYYAALASTGIFSQEVCEPIDLDLAILFDVSASIGTEYFNLGTKILLGIANKLNAPKNSINLSILTYSTNLKLVKDIINSQSAKDDMIKSINQLNYENPQRTSTTSAIRYLSRYVFNKRQGNAPRILLVITDGLFDHAEMAADSIRTEINKLIDTDVEIFSMPIADENNVDNIKEMVTSLPTDIHLILPGQINLFYEVVNDRTAVACNSNAFYFIK